MIKRISLSIICTVLFTSLISASSGIYSKDKNSDNLIEKRWESYVTSLFTQLTGSTTGLKLDVFRKALAGYYNLEAKNKLSDKNLLTIVDFTLPSNKKRMWVINISLKKVLYNSLVSHGRNTGTTYAKSFSNEAETHKSSIGFYVTGETYIGKHNLSLRLLGMDPSFNCRAFDRAIVMHGAEYVSEQWIKKYGMLGRSFGCPAIPFEISDKLINQLAGGTCLFLYFPDKEYEKKSNLLNEKLASINFFEHNYTYKL